MTTYKPNEVLVAMALKEEGGEALKKTGARVLYTGLGKVNAAYALTKSIIEHKPRLVLNVGTAGSKLFNRGELIAAHRFIQRDMDVSPLGFRRFETPFENTPIVLEFPVVFTHLPQATVGTGDSFETNHNHDRGEVVDMEAFALAKICRAEEIQFACVKYISDGADEQASDHWKESLKNLPERFVELYQKLLKS